MSGTHDPIGILFVCMGNLCRSPLAEGVFRHQVARRDVDGLFRVDSAGTGGWHAGEPPDPRVADVASRHGVRLTGVARQVRARDLDRFDLIVCMDESNREDLLEIGAPKEKVRLLLTFDPEAPMLEVPDPYYGGPDGFDLVFRLVERGCAALLDTLLADKVRGAAGSDEPA